MATEMLQYLDPDGLGETVLNIGQIKTNLEGQMQDLPYARPDGLYPDMTVGAVIGADSTAQWAQRVTAGSGAATVRSVQGAVEVQDSVLVPVRIAGIRSTDAQGGELDSVEWPTQTLRAAGSVADMLYSDHVDVNVGVVVLTGGVNLVEVTGSGTYVNARIAVRGFDGATAGGITSDQFTNNPTAGWKGLTAGQIRATSSGFWIGLSADVSTIALANAWLAEHQPIVFYELATPTTTPISPTLPMTYRVEQGGTESIIVPTGEVSAAPVLTVAEPVNAGDEFARIWAAIESLGYTRNTAQLSRPVSLTDIGSIDEVQKDTTDVVENEAAEVAEIDTVKEVQE